jgi:hypothetical protein
MAIFQVFPSGCTVWGDGVATTATFDLSAKLNQLGVPPNAQGTILSIGHASGITSSTLVGSILSVVFTNPPPVNTSVLSLQLGF